MLLFLWLGILILITHISAMRQTSENVCLMCVCRGQLLNCNNSNIIELPSVWTDLNVTTITFARNKILRIRKFPKLLVKTLSFAHNDITNIDDAAFKDLVDLVILDLSHNLLTSDSLLPSAFQGKYAPDAYEPLRRLKELNVAYNQLHTLHPNVFEHLPNLEVLHLSGNPLKFISHGTTVALSSTPFLKELYLSKTSLKNLPQNLFHMPKYLEVLDLSDNLFTEPPKELENSHRIRLLSLNGNSIQHIRNSLVLPFLKILHLSQMPQLISIEGRSLSDMPSLEEFYCSDNPNLVKIEKTVFSAVNLNGEGETWPPLKVLMLNNNSLRSIESHLLSRWDNLKIINIEDNPWLCDCENQWLVSTLTPTIKNLQSSMTVSFKCAEPIEMKDMNIVDLYHRGYQMRCLDYYQHMPEKDGKLLIDVCVLAIFLTPFLMSAVLYYKRKQRLAPRYHKMFFNKAENDLNYF